MAEKKEKPFPAPAPDEKSQGPRHLPPARKPAHRGRTRYNHRLADWDNWEPLYHKGQPVPAQALLRDGRIT